MTTLLDRLWLKRTLDFVSILIVIAWLGFGSLWPSASFSTRISYSVDPEMLLFTMPIFVLGLLWLIFRFSHWLMTSIAVSPANDRAPVGWLRLLCFLGAIAAIAALIFVQHNS